MSTLALPSHLTYLDDESLRQAFETLAAKWRRETIMLSSSSEKVLHPAYQRIIGLGPAVIPLVLRELEQHGGHWFWALRALTGENPVKPEDVGQVRKMTEAWLEWGKQWGLV
jgi:hypothetical protein